MRNPHPNTSGLKRTAGPGRPKGSKDKIAQRVLLEMQQFFASPAYAASVKERTLAGKAPHLESYWLNKLHGKPVELHEITGAEGGPLRVEYVIVHAAS